MSENLEQVNNSPDTSAIDVAAASSNDAAASGSAVKRGRRKTRIGKVVSN